ncbi:MAG: T9SS type A sorting domain-containing protein [Bacteroidota bacterium]
MRTRAFLLVGLAVAVASSSQAQGVGSCELGSAVRLIDSGALQMKLRNTGTLFEYPYGESGASTARGYVVRDGRDRFPNAGVSLLLVGTVEGEPRGAMGYYSGFEFWPGPLDDAGSPPTDCAAYDRIYIVSRRDIERYYETGELTDDLRDWPHHLGAPVLDGDGDPTNYDLRAGDQPDLIGDVAAWWVMHDAGNEHRLSRTEPLGVEARTHVFVYESASLEFRYTPFIRYEIVNRNAHPIEEMYAGNWANVEGDIATNQLIGTDTLRSVLYRYDSEYENLSEVLPSWGIQVVQAPIGLANGRDDDFDGSVDEPDERLGLTSSAVFINAGPDGTNDPRGIDELYNVVRGRWGNGTPRRAYGGGFQQTQGAMTSFMFWGDPVTQSFWSAINAFGTEEGVFRYRRIGMASGPFQIEPGEAVSILYALPYGRGTSNLQSVAKMRAVASTLQRLHAEGVFASSPVERPQESSELALARISPNPSFGTAQALLTLPATAHVRATVYDALGRQLEVVVDGELPRGENKLTMPAGLAPGTYLLRVEVPGAVETLTFTVVR